MLASLIQHNEALKGLAVEANMISVVLFSSADVLSIISDTLKTWGRQFKEQHERMNKISSWVYNIKIWRQWCDDETVQGWNGEMVEWILNGEMVISWYRVTLYR